MLNVSRLRTLFSDQRFSGSSGSAVSVSLPSGSIINLQQTNADSISEILRKVSNFCSFQVKMNSFHF